ncbi:hypothetical protein V7S43_013749 [Phytophthora oleae]|uniref:Uncharacterized protein n=1 Tax=Phytophthora oleae TaxID=2107226 RepID=A0ABD3F2V5_9STRA
MAYSTEIELQGVTAFEAPPAPSFRYTIALKDNKLSIWMEDCISKKQWYKGDMGTSDFTSSANSILTRPPVTMSRSFKML